MQIRKLTVENCVEFFNSFDYTEEQFKGNIFRNLNRFGLKGYRNVTEKLVEYFYDTYTNVDIGDVNTSYIGSPIYLNNNNKRDKLLKNISRIRFRRMYPNIILNLCDTGVTEFNVKEYTEIYRFLINNIDSIINHPNSKKTTPLLARSITNMVYLASNSVIDNLIRIPDCGKIVNYYKDNYSSLLEIDSVISTNCDEIFFIDDGSGGLEEHIKDLKLPYTIEHGITAYFFQLNKFIIDDGKYIKCKGYGDITNRLNSRRRKGGNIEKVIEIYNQMNLDLRKRKIERIKDGIIF